MNNFTFDQRIETLLPITLVGCAKALVLDIGYALRLENRSRRRTKQFVPVALPTRRVFVK